MHIKIKPLKKYGTDTQLWYYPYVGETFKLWIDTKKGYLVFRDDMEDTRKWLIKHKHGEELQVDDMV